MAGLVSVVKSGCREVWIASGGNSTMHSIFFFVLDSTLCSVATTSHKGVKDSRQSTLHSKKPCVQAADSRESWLGGTLGYTEKSSLREENKNITSLLVMMQEIHCKLWEGFLSTSSITGAGSLLTEHHCCHPCTVVGTADLCLSCLYMLYEHCLLF